MHFAVYAVDRHLGNKDESKIIYHAFLFMQMSMFYLKSEKEIHSIKSWVNNVH